MSRVAWMLPALWLALAALPAAAEPMFLSRQYARCTSCHFSPTGGGMLTSYGRSLSREELSTTGRSASGQASGREQQFLFGLLGDSLGDFSLGINLRPSHLRFEFGGDSSTRDLLMNADVTGAWRHGGFTLYGEFGRQPLGSEAEVKSFEHWVEYRSENGLGVRAGRFLPAYGVRFADHTSFNRAPMGFGTQDQLYGVELSLSGERRLFQFTLSPGEADALLDNDGSAAFTATGRAQFDVGSRTAIVASGLYRAASDVASRSEAFGLAIGHAPTSRLTLWGQADLRFRDGLTSAYTLTSEASFEVFRGVWLKFTPQYRTEHGLRGAQAPPGHVGHTAEPAGTFRLGASVELLPRTHWNGLLGYYRDSDRASGLVFTTLLAQLHLYL